MNQAVREKEMAQWVDEAALLWLRREHLTGEPHLHLPEHLARDRLLQARLDALREDDSTGWRICERELVWEEPGELFPATILAVANQTPQRMSRVLDYALRSNELARPVVSALAWTPLESVIDLLEDWLTSHDALLRHIALAAAIGHRQVPVSALAEALGAEQAMLCARGVRGVGEVGCLELLPQVIDLIDDPRADVAFEAAWTCALRGHRERATDKLWQIARAGTRLAARAVAVAARVTATKLSVERLQQLGGCASLQRTALYGTAALGSTELVEWLISWLDAPATARLAGEAISTITGLDLHASSCFVVDGYPDTVHDVSDLDGDGTLEFDPDEHIPWPLPTRIKAWWRAHRDAFHPDQRYLRGLTISPATCRRVLREGRQRERQFAALELAASDDAEPLFEIRAAADRQIEQLDLAAKRVRARRQDGD